MSPDALIDIAALGAGLSSPGGASPNAQQVDNLFDSDVSE